MVFKGPDVGGEGIGEKKIASERESRGRAREKRDLQRMDFRG